MRAALAALFIACHHRYAAGYAEGVYCYENVCEMEFELCRAAGSLAGVAGLVFSATANDDGPGDASG